MLKYCAFLDAEFFYHFYIPRFTFIHRDAKHAYKASIKADEPSFSAHGIPFRDLPIYEKNYRFSTIVLLSLFWHYSEWNGKCKIGQVVSGVERQRKSAVMDTRRLVRLLWRNIMSAGLAVSCFFYLSHGQPDERPNDYLSLSGAYIDPTIVATWMIRYSEICPRKRGMVQPVATIPTVIVFWWNYIVTTLRARKDLAFLYLNVYVEWWSRSLDVNSHDDILVLCVLNTGLREHSIESHGFFLSYYPLLMKRNNRKTIIFLLSHSKESIK